MVSPEVKQLSAEEILAIARADGERVYGPLSGYRVELSLEPDGWHVAYFIKQPSDPKIRIAGGGPHYVIHPEDGRILSKKYYQ